MRSIERSIARAVDGAVDRSSDRSVGQSLDRSFVRSIRVYLSIDRSIDRSAEILHSICRRYLPSISPTRVPITPQKAMYLDPKCLHIYIYMYIYIHAAVAVAVPWPHICIYRHRYILKMSRYSAVVFIIVPAEGWNHAEGIRN